MNKFSVRLYMSAAVLSLGIMQSCSSPIMQSASQQSDSDSTAVADTVHSLTLLFAGDLMQHAPQFAAARCSDGTYDYTECFASVKHKIEAADVAIANFETTLGGPPYAGYPQFCSPDAYASAVRDAGFDILLTANNHSMDTGGRGVVRTLDVMDSLSIPHLGTYRDSLDRAKHYPFLLEKNGIRVALLNYTYGTNGIRVQKPCIVNSLNEKEQIEKDILAAKAMHPDAIIATVHWGVEYVLHPTRQQEEMAQWLLDHGVDHVIGGHPHVVQPIEVRSDSAKSSNHLVVYSLGNYISNMTKQNQDGGLMVSMTLQKKAEHTNLSDCSYSLVWVSRPRMSGHKTHRVYPVDIEPALLNNTERQAMKNFTDVARALFSECNIGISEK